MLGTLVALAMIAMAPAPTLKMDDKADVLATIRQFVDNFNKGDAKTAAAACAEHASILDEFPPYEWTGKGACATWMKAYDSDAAKSGIADGLVTLGTPRHVDISGDRAYAVIPSDYAFKKKGVPVKETGSMFTFALQKTPAGWRIVAWSWAKN